MKYYTLLISLVLITSVLNAQYETQSIEDYTTILPNKYLPYETFAQKFNLKDTTTEMYCEKTSNLSSILKNGIVEGLDILLEIDSSVVHGLRKFQNEIDPLVDDIYQRLRKGGRVFLVGSGSSGRVSIDLAAKCQSFMHTKDQRVIGIIAGGDRAMIRAKEGFEDSVEDGAQALVQFKISPKDTVFVISASGSSSFNVGCANFAADQGAKVYYFYNSSTVPERTKSLFLRKINPAIPLLLDIGPQAIAGSTRLQGATIAEAALGALLADALVSYRLGKKSCGYVKDVIDGIEKGNSCIRKSFSPIATIIGLEYTVFSHSNANFRSTKDSSNQGYVTLLATDSTFREILIDATETSPTFSTNPQRAIHEQHRKRAEFQAYLSGTQTNSASWKILLGRGPLTANDFIETSQFLITCEEEGQESYAVRPHGKGNLVIGVFKSSDGAVPQPLLRRLKEAKQEGAFVACIAVTKKPLDAQSKSTIESIIDSHALVEINNIDFDPFGIVPTVVLKETLNLISNGSMIMMNKVLGNQMIDVRASNNKLIDRSMRLISSIWNRFHPTEPIHNEYLYKLVLYVHEKSQQRQNEGFYCPSVVKTSLCLLETKTSFETAVQLLCATNENIEYILEGKVKEPSTN